MDLSVHPFLSGKDDLKSRNRGIVGKAIRVVITGLRSDHNALYGSDLSDLGTHPAKHPEGLFFVALIDFFGVSINALIIVLVVE